MKTQGNKAQEDIIWWFHLRLRLSLENLTVFFMYFKVQIVNYFMYVCQENSFELGLIVQSCCTHYCY